MREFGSEFHDFSFRGYGLEIIVCDKEKILMTVDVLGQILGSKKFVDGDLCRGIG